MLMGFWSVDDEGVAPGNDQFQLMGLLVLKSVKPVHAPSQIVVSPEEKPATGGSQEIIVIKEVLFTISVP